MNNNSYSSTTFLIGSVFAIGVGIYFFTQTSNAGFRGKSNQRNTSITNISEESKDIFSTIDLGDVFVNFDDKESWKRTADFEVNNDSSNDCTITVVGSSCGCTTIDEETINLPGNGQVTIPLNVSFGYELKRLSEAVYLNVKYGDHPKGKMTLLVKCRCIPTVTFAPFKRRISLECSKTETLEPVELSIIGRCKSGIDLSQFKLLACPDHLSAKISDATKNMDDGEIQTCIATLVVKPKQFLEESCEGVIRVAFGESSISIRTEMSPRRYIHCLPAAVFAKADSKSKTVELKLTAKQEFSITGVDVGNRETDFQVVSENEIAKTIRLKLGSLNNTKNSLDRIRIKTNHPRQSLVDVPIHLLVLDSGQ